MSLQRLPIPLAVMGWDGDLITPLVGSITVCAPLLVNNHAPCCFEAATGLGRASVHR